MLLADGLSHEGDALLTAASIAGAASLVLDTTSEAVRHSIRNGIVDFAVKNLDEALRILKNEIRKHQPIAVLLQQQTATAMAAMVERGAQPDLLRCVSETELVATLRERGAVTVPADPGGPLDLTGEVRWSAAEGGSAALRYVDQVVQQLLPAEDAARQNWITRAPRYLSRAMRLERSVPMSAAEAESFLEALQQRAHEGVLPSAVSVQHDGRTVVFTPSR